MCYQPKEMQEIPLQTATLKMDPNMLIGLCRSCQQFHDGRPAHAPRQSPANGGKIPS